MSLTTGHENADGPLVRVVRGATAPDSEVRVSKDRGPMDQGEGSHRADGAPAA